MSEEETFQDFVDTLESFKELKSGISGSRIKKLTAFALENVKDEEKIVDAIIEYANTCPDSHRLGSLYIIDSIGRAYLDEARARDDYIKPTAKIGSAAHAIYTLGESIQHLLVTAISRGSDDHKDKIKTLIDIWDRTGLFQKGYLNAVRAKVFAMDDSLSRNINSNSPEKEESLPEDPKERAISIINNLKPLDPVPDVKITDELTSDETFEQHDALRKLLVSLQIQLAKQPIQPQTQVPPEASRVEQPPHRVTEYGSRRERERQHDRYSSRRNRSRSPLQRGDNRYGNDNNDHHGMFGRRQQNFGPNNHHLYPDEMNYPQNPHSRPKPVSFDPSLPPESIKVLSRTLFLGGVPMNMKEWDIANILKPYADVQSVILNNHRKHAFVKVYSRREAENVLMNFNLDGSYPLRTRWGVGFGPRDCCDYQHGYSVIPIRRLTDADRKWSVEAQWGGTNGQPLAPGIVFEEPDIIVGDGVSSKAISQRVPTDSAKNGPRSNREDRRGGNGYVGYQQPMQGGYMNQPNQMYGQMPPSQQGGYMGQGDMYGQQMGGYGAPPPPQQQQMIGQPPMGGAPMPGQGPNQPPPQQSQPTADPQAQLNSLMSMLNQQQR